MSLELQRCTTCGAVQLRARSLCTACGGTGLAPAQAVGTGTLYSFTVVRRPLRPEVAVPYVVAIVRLTEGPALLTHLVDCPPASLRCGLAVDLVWRSGIDGRPLAVFAPRPPSAHAVPEPLTTHDA